MTTLLKAKKHGSSLSKRKSVGGSLALKQKRGTNQRSHVVRNMVRRNGVFIAAKAPIFHSGENYAFELETKTDLLFLPPLGYVGKRAEVEDIKKRVVADNMTQKEIDQIAAAVEKRLTGKFVTKSDLDSLATEAAVTKGFNQVDLQLKSVEKRFDKLDADVTVLTNLVHRVTKSASAADPRPE